MCRYRTGNSPRPKTKTRTNKCKVKRTPNFESIYSHAFFVSSIRKTWTELLPGKRENKIKRTCAIVVCCWCRRSQTHTSNQIAYQYLISLIPTDELPCLHFERFHTERNSSRRVDLDHSSRRHSYSIGSPAIEHKHQPIEVRRVFFFNLPKNH